MTQVFEVYNRVLVCQSHLLDVSSASLPSLPAPALLTDPPTPTRVCSTGELPVSPASSAANTSGSSTPGTSPLAARQAGHCGKLMPSARSVQVKIELGHRALLRKKTSADGCTHDWTVFVRGPEGSNISHFVEKVVFHLHETFPKPKRVKKEPPYEVSESGYGSFNIPIEIIFKTRDDVTSRKIRFDYDLFLHLEGPSDFIRCEKLTFKAPTEDFRNKLIRGGGLEVGEPSRGGQPPAAATPQTPDFMEDLFGAPPPPPPPAAAAAKHHKPAPSLDKPRPKPPHKSKSSSQLKDVKESKESKDNKESKSTTSSGSSSKPPSLAGTPTSHPPPFPPAPKPDNKPPQPEKQTSRDKSKSSSSSSSKRPLESGNSGSPLDTSASSSKKKKKDKEKERERESSSHRHKEKDKVDKDKDREKEKREKKDDKESSQSSVKSSHSRDGEKSKSSSSSSKDKHSKSSSSSKSKSHSSSSSKSKKHSKDKEKEWSRHHSGSSRHSMEKSSPVKDPLPPPPPQIKAKPLSSQDGGIFSTGENSDDDLFGDHKSEASSIHDFDQAMRKPAPPPKHPTPPPTPPTQPSQDKKAKKPLAMLVDDMADLEDSDQEDIVSPIKPSPPFASHAAEAPNIHKDPGPPPPSLPELGEDNRESSSASSSSDDSDTDYRAAPPAAKKRKSLSGSPAYSTQSRGSSGSGKKRGRKSNAEKAAIKAQLEAAAAKEQAAKSQSSKSASSKYSEPAKSDPPSSRGPAAVAKQPPTKDCAPLTPSNDLTPAPPPPALDDGTLRDLLALQRTLMTVQDTKLLQQVILVIEETGKFHIGRDTFDFDLCMLDRQTVQKIQTCLQAAISS